MAVDVFFAFALDSTGVSESIPNPLWNMDYRTQSKFFSLTA